VNIDDIARRNQAFWKKMASERGGETSRYTRPWPDLEIGLLEAFIRGDLEMLPEPYTYIYPPSVLAGARDKEVLCLAASGGQQSVVFGLLGSRVTVFDLTGEQLEADREMARHYGYEVKTVQGDMRDLSCFEAGAFDLVYQAVSACFVPDLGEVYRQVARLVKPGGVYRVEHCHPATHTVEEESWDGRGYRIEDPYGPGMVEDPDAVEFTHLMSDIFNGLVECGFVIRGVWDDPRHLRDASAAKPGTYDHLLDFVAKHFAIVAEKPAG
jgi:SAM-dependent methyltransferase